MSEAVESPRSVFNEANTIPRCIVGNPYAISRIRLDANAIIDG